MNQEYRATLYSILAFAIASAIGLSGCTDAMLSVEDTPAVEEEISGSRFRNAHLLDRAVKTAGKRVGWMGFVVSLDDTTTELGKQKLLERTSSSSAVSCSSAMNSWSGRRPRPKLRRS